MSTAPLESLSPPAYRAGVGSVALSAAASGRSGVVADVPSGDRRVIPAYNEAESIEAVLRSLLKQTRLPDEIHVIVNNTKDDTFELAAKFAGPRTAKKKRKGEPASRPPRSSSTTSARTRTRRSAR